MRAAAARGVFTTLDPNIRAVLIPDTDAYRAGLESWAAVGVAPQALRGGRAVAGGTPREWLASGPAAVVITQGGDGLTVFTQDGSVAGAR